MKAAFNITVLAVLLVAPSPCFALWLIAPVSKEGAKELGMEVRSNVAGPDAVRVELEFDTKGELKSFSRVDLEIRDKGKLLVSSTLREERSNRGRVVVSFSADRGQLDKLTLRVMVPESNGGTIYDLRVKDFVELKKDR